MSKLTQYTKYRTLSAISVNIKTSDLPYEKQSLVCLFTNTFSVGIEGKFIIQDGCQVFILLDCSHRLPSLVHDYVLHHTKGCLLPCHPQT